MEFETLGHWVNGLCDIGKFRKCETGALGHWEIAMLGHWETGLRHWDMGDCEIEKMKIAGWGSNTGNLKLGNWETATLEHKETGTPGNWDTENLEHWEN